MPKDFKASQLRTHKIVASGSDDKPYLLIYASGSATNDSGGINAGRLAAVGRDVWMWVSGARGSNEKVLFGGDVHVSGTLTAPSITGSIGRVNASTPFLAGVGGTTVTYNSSTGQWAIDGGGGSSVAGSGGEIQYNDGSSALTASSAFSFNPVQRRVSIGTVTQDASLLVYGSGTFTYVTSSIVKITSLTAGRVPYVGSDEELVDSSALRFGSTTGALTSSYFFANSGIRDNSLTAGRVLYAGPDKEISDDSGFTYDSAGNRLTSTFITVTQDITASAVLSTDITGSNVKVNSLTAGRVLFAGADKEISDDSGLIYDSVNNVLTASYVYSPNGLRDGSLTSSRVVFAGVDGVLSDDSGFTYDSTGNRLTSTFLTVTQDITGSAILVTDFTGSNAKLNSLTAGRVLFAGPNKEIADDNGLIYDSTNNVLTASSIYSPSGLIDGTLTAGRVIFAGAGGALSDDVGFTYDSGDNRLSSAFITVTQDITASAILSTDITGSNVKVNSLTAGRVLFAGSSKEIADDSGLIYDASANALTASIVYSPSGLRDGTLTAGRVVFVGGGGFLSDEAGFTYDASTDRLSVDYVTVGQSVTASYVRVPTLTGGQVVFPSSTGELSGSGDLAFNPITGRLTVDGGILARDDITVTGSLYISGNIYATEFITNYISSSIIYASGSTKFGDSADDTHQFIGTMTVQGGGQFTYLTSSNLRVPSLTNGRVVFAGVGGEITDDVGFTYDSTNNRLSTSFLSVSQDITGSAILVTDFTGSNARLNSLTAGRVLFAGADKEITDDVGFTYDSSDNRLSFAFGTVSQSLTASYIRSAQITGSISRTIGGSPFVTGSNGIAASYDDSVGQWTINGSGAGAQVAGSSGELQFNDGSSALTASNALSFNPVTKTLSVGTNSIDASLRVFGSGTFTYVTSSVVKVTSLTSGRVVFAGPDDELADDANLVYDAANNVLTASTVYAAGGLRDGSLTAGRVVLAGSDGNLADDSGLTYDATNNRLTSTFLTVTQDITGSSVLATDVTSSNVRITSLTAGRVLFAGSSKEVSDDVGFTYDPTGNRLSFSFGTVAQSLTASYLRSSQITGSIYNVDGSTPFLTGTGGTSLSYNNSTGQWTVSSSIGGGGSGTPGGLDTQVQFNNAGSFGGSGNFTFVNSSNALTLTGSLTVTGSMQMTGSIMPGADNLYDLGATNMRWANIYTGDLHLRNDRGSWTIIEEEDYLSITNNKNGRRYKFALIPLEE